MDLPKFLKCTNESAAPGRVFIYHSQKPRFVAEVYHNDGGSKDVNVIEMIDSPSEKEIADVPKLMRRMGDWYYYNYMKKNEHS